MDGILEKAILLAVKAHSGQCDKGGKPYIFHLLRVMLSMHTEREQVCGVLHDILHTDVTAEQLRGEGFDEELIQTLQRLAKRGEDSYEQYIDGLLEDETACHVKLADLQDNLDMSRIASPKAEDYERVSSYRKAIKQIEFHLAGGNRD